MADPVNPVLQDIRRAEIISDPALRELYFGSPDTPGLIAQATAAAQKAYLDQPAILQRTAGLTPDELRARQIARAGIGSFEPFLGRAEQAYGRGLGALQTSLGFGGPSARQYLGLSMQQYDPRMAGMYYDPFEQQVVQQTIEDTLKAAAQQDIQQRAADIARGGESAFGSRARLTAGERQEALGRGLGDVLARIRSGGFQTAQERSLQELERQRAGARTAAQLEAGFGGDIAAAQRLYGADISGLGQMGQQLRAADIAELERLGGTERAIEEQRLARQYAQQLEQRQAPLQATQFVQGFAPQYVAGQTQVQKQYGMPIDPLQYGLSTALGTYASLYQQPQMQQQAPTPAPAPSSAPATTTIGGFNPYAPPIPSYQPGQVTIPPYTPPAQGIGSVLQNPYAPPIPSYQPGQINLPSTLPAGGYFPPGTFGG